jgi:hypothetical protein
LILAVQSEQSKIIIPIEQGLITHLLCIDTHALLPLLPYNSNDLDPYIYVCFFEATASIPGALYKGIMKLPFLEVT